MARFRIVTALLVFAIAALALSLLLVGTVDVPAVEVWRILTGRPSDYEPWNFIIFESRLPLVVTAALAGGALAVSGLLLQTLFGNTLADPSILGISTGASLGAGCAMLAFGRLVCHCTWCRRWRICSHAYRRICGSDGCDGFAARDVERCEEQHDVADCWYLDRLYRLVGNLVA